MIKAAAATITIFTTYTDIRLAPFLCKGVSITPGLKILLLD